MNLGTAEIPPPRPPAVPTPVDATAHEAVTPPKRRRATDHETLLIVDDQPENLSVLGELLQGAGYHVKVANNGHVALHLARQLPRPGLILLDVVMPEMDGPTLLGELRQRNPNTKVVFVSGYAEEAFRKNLPEGKDFHFLPKPFTMKQLVETVKAAMG